VTIRVGIGTPGFTGAALFILSALLAAGVLRLSLSELPPLEAPTIDSAEPVIATA